jgi:Trypsin-co-occurring domain 2
MSDDLQLNLTELVTAVRDQLEELDRARILAEKPPLFHLSRMELELAFTVVESDAIKGGFDLKVVSLGGQTSLRSEQIQRIKLSFEVPAEAIKAGVPGTRAHSTSRRTASADVEPLR